MSVSLLFLHYKAHNVFIKQKDSYEHIEETCPFLENLSQVKQLTVVSFLAELTLNNRI